MRKVLMVAGAVLLASTSFAAAKHVSPDVKCKLDRKLARIGVTKYDHISWHRLGKHYKVDDAVIGGVKYDIYINADMSMYKKRKELIQR